MSAPGRGGRGAAAVGAEALLGGERAAAEPDPLVELARTCAYLPLALRIAAAHLTLAPHRTVTGYLTRLRAGSRLDELAADADSTVRAAFDPSCQDLPAPARRLFRLLGLAPGGRRAAGHQRRLRGGRAAVLHRRWQPADPHRAAGSLPGPVRERAGLTR